MLGLLNRLDWKIAPIVLFIWLLWGWAATKLMQGFISGEGGVEAVTDINVTTTVLYTGLMGIFVVAGLFLTGGVL